MLQYTTFDTPLWELILVGTEQGITNLHIMTDQTKRQFEIDPSWKRNDSLFDKAKTQLLEYFAGKRKEFTLNLIPQGTDFQKKVWSALGKIPYGEVRTYKDIAIATGNSNSSRAVGMANSKNPIPIIVPCHRVIGSNGKLTGFALGLKAKEHLLNIEKGK
ncbi:methylated-DNA--[protein]-cysteine S-methyltransferase [uncultured Pseudodesulfovibrio sp.]|uniref:methylated-DNA--[protein]-cysteine S-methyltransferase n=1 Tax=uncultured Pseudodesulfovibrio sp. TaxID=2035858 RepID=UPI0029C8AE46|nr:methylated-DNA--[protein]-cysteine S-methyltransferase [uncultured Pseudodesulfovibrio sp.]